MQKVFPDDWELVSVTDLPDNSFLLDREDYHVPCVFQVWRKVNGESTQNLRESCKVKKATEDFCFTSKEGADYFIFGASPSKILEKYLVKPSNRGYYIKQKAAQTLDLLKKIDWKSNAKSSVSGGVAWYSKQEIINIYEGFKNETDTNNHEDS
jgi:hypothetical protein